MWWWKRLTHAHERWLRRFWRGRRAPSRWIGVADLLYRMGWGGWLYAMGGLQSVEGSLVIGMALTVVHPVLPWGWKVGLGLGAGLLAFAHPLLGLGVVLAGLVGAEVVLFQTYELALFFPLWGVWSWLDMRGNPASFSWFLAFWVVLAYGWAHKLAEPPLVVLLEDEDFQAWLEEREVPS